MKYVVKETVREEFEVVAGTVIDRWPEILTTGIELKQLTGSFYDGEYVIVDSGGDVVNDTIFFTVEEMTLLTPVK